MAKEFVAHATTSTTTTATRRTSTTSTSRRRTRTSRTATRTRSTAAPRIILPKPSFRTSLQSLEHALVVPSFSNLFQHDHEHQSVPVRVVLDDDATEQQSVPFHHHFQKYYPGTTIGDTDASVLAVSSPTHVGIHILVFLVLIVGSLITQERQQQHVAFSSPQVHRHTHKTASML